MESELFFVENEGPYKKSEREYYVNIFPGYEGIGSWIYTIIRLDRRLYNSSLLIDKILNKEELKTMQRCYTWSAIGHW